MSDFDPIIANVERAIRDFRLKALNSIGLRIKLHEACIKLSMLQEKGVITE